MGTFFIQYLAIYKKENLWNSKFKFFQNFA